VSVATETRLDSAIDAATSRLLELQHPGGWWVGELESNATMIAQHLFWHHVLGLRTPELDCKIANELRARQRDDGTWSIWFEGPADLSTSVEAYAALRLAGVDPGEQAREYIRREGGISRTRIFTKCFLALLGQWPWSRIVPIPVELALLPPGASSGLRTAQSPFTVTSSFTSQSDARTSAGCSGPRPESRSARTARPVSQTGDWQASGRSRSPSSLVKPSQPSTALLSVSSSKPCPSEASIRIDQTHGGWIPPQEPSASW